LVIEFLLFSPNPGLLRPAANGLPGIKLEDNDGMRDVLASAREAE